LHDTRDFGALNAFTERLLVLLVPKYQRVGEYLFSTSRRCDPCYRRTMVLPLRELLCVAMVAALLLGSAPVIGQAYRFQSPFHPSQCDEAIESAERSLAEDPRDSAARLILAEGFLCRGLEGDAAAVNRAISLLTQLVADNPENFFAQLELADALRKRDATSEEAERALRRAGALLARADVGAARGVLQTYIQENLTAIVETRGRLANLRRPDSIKKFDERRLR
jgi:hypothetical protein